MSGGGKSSKSSSGETSATPDKAAPTVQTREFGGPIDPAILQQLAAGGLSGILPNPGVFQSASLPLITSPADVATYLKSRGQAVMSQPSAPVAAPAVAPDQNMGLLGTAPAGNFSQLYGKR